MKRDIYYKLDGNQTGPISSTQLKQLLDGQYFKANALVKLPNSSTWRKASSIKPKTESEVVTELSDVLSEPTLEDFDAIQIQSNSAKPEEAIETSNPIPDLVDLPQIDPEPPTKSTTNRDTVDFKSRYPHLFTYWMIIRVTTMVSGAISLGIWLLVVIFGVIELIQPSGSNPQAFSSITMGLSGCVGTLFTYAFVMAILEFVKVQVDIERGVRKITEAI